MQFNILYIKQGWSFGILYLHPFRIQTHLSFEKNFKKISFCWVSFYENAFSLCFLRLVVLCVYLNRPPPPFFCDSWLLRPIWLLSGGEKCAGGRVGDVLKSSSMSRTLARRLLEGGSISFILFWICMVFRLNFSPGRDILKSQGIHWRNITRTWNFASSKD